MPTQMIDNPAAAFQSVTDYLTYKAANGEELAYPRTVDTFVANDTIAVGDWVAFVAVAGASGPGLRVEKMDVSDATAAMLKAGVAREAATAGEMLQVTTRGVALCNIGDTAAVALGDAAVKHATTDGASGRIANASIDATTVTGTILGTYLGPEIGTTNQAPVWVW